MNLQGKSFTELQALFQVVFEDWQASNLLMEGVKKKKCEKYSDFVRCRADLRHFARENAKLHNKMVRLDLELQIRAWTGLND